MERRSYATIKKQWDIEKVMVTSPQIEFEEYMKTYCKGEITRDEVISIMVGDLQRIRIYAEKGFQIYQEIPEDVQRAFDKLVEHGFTAHLIK